MNGSKMEFYVRVPEEAGIVLSNSNFRNLVMGQKSTSDLFVQAAGEAQTLFPWMCCYKKYYKRRS